MTGLVLDCESVCSYHVHDELDVTCEYLWM